MSVIINSGVPASASYETSLTTPPLILNQPGVNGQSGTILISSVYGLQAALDAKLNDTLGPVGITNVVATGLDLGKLADIDATAAEINYLIGVTSPVQDQIDASFSVDDFTAANQVIFSTAAGVADVELLADVLDGTVGPGYQFSDLLPPTQSLNFNGQRGINAADPQVAQDLATKSYVDNAVTGAGAFLPLAGGTMEGSIDLDSNYLSFGSITDGFGTYTVGWSLDGSDVILGMAFRVYAWNNDAFSLDGAAIINMADPVDAQSATTKNYTDTTFLRLTGGNMTGNLDMNASSVRFNSDDTVTLQSTVTEELRLTLGTTEINFAPTTVFFDGADLAGLPAVPGTALSAITLQYANGNYLRVDGTNGPLEGDLDMDGNILSNPADPVAGNQVGDRDFNDTRYLQILNNLSDLDDVAVARFNLELAPVASTGNYNDLINTPGVPADLGDLGDVVTGSPGPAQDGFVLAWSNLSTTYNLVPAPVRSVFGRTGNVLASSGDYLGAQITNVPAGNVAATTVQGAINELDTEKLARSGAQTMLGSLDLSGNQLLNAALPLTVGAHAFTAADYRSALGGQGFLIRTTATPAVGTPTYSFVSDPNTGMWLDGSGLNFSVEGVNELIITPTEINAADKPIKDVSDPVDDQDAVTLNYLRGLGVQRILGFTTGINLLTASPGDDFPIYDVPVGRQHIITKVIVVTTSYTPGVGPVDAVVSIGTAGPDNDQIVNTATLSWGPAGAGDQAVYIDPDQGAETPNSNNTISLQVNSPADGTFTALIASVYIMGYEL